VIVLLVVVGVAVASPDIFAPRLLAPLPLHRGIPAIRGFGHGPLAIPAIGGIAPHGIPALRGVAPIGIPALHHAPRVPLAVSHYAPHVTGPANQHHSQDEIGQFRYGYTNPDSYKEEAGAADGTVHGQYGWISPEGDRIHISYTAGHHGFQSTGAHIPL